jgi:hypothetical protein
MKKSIFMTLGVFTCIFSNASQPLVISYGATHLNKVDNSVRGVAITPSGTILKTDPLSPFEQYNLVIDSPDIGEYTVYYEALETGDLRICQYVGGIIAFLCAHPENAIPLFPKEARIQAFPPRKALTIGSQSTPIGSFHLSAEDLE